jgi:hypothetical protein
MGRLMGLAGPPWPGQVLGFYFYIYPIRTKINIF